MAAGEVRGGHRAEPQIAAPRTGPIFKIFFFFFNIDNGGDDQREKQTS